jgi:3-oxoacyl-[acyl-carrier protein] reductase
MSSPPSSRPSIPLPKISLLGHVALITGANHGIGAATARALAAAGARVFLNFLRTPTSAGPGVPDAYWNNRARDAAEVVAAIRTAGGEAEALEADLTDPAVPARLFDVAERAFGPVDILINNATGWIYPSDTFKDAQSDRHGRRLQGLTAKTFDQVFAVDARASALLIAEFARRHRQRGANWGRIISLTSGGPGGFPEEVSYGAAKAALDNYTMAASKELADLGITANCVYPPVTDTGWVTDSVRELVRTSDDHVHVAQPEEVAEVIVYLVSDSARLITGNILYLR